MTDSAYRLLASIASLRIETSVPSIAAQRLQYYTALGDRPGQFKRKSPVVQENNALHLLSDVPKSGCDAGNDQNAQ